MPTALWIIRDGTTAAPLDSQVSERVLMMNHAAVDCLATRLVKRQYLAPGGRPLKHTQASLGEKWESASQVGFGFFSFQKRCAVTLTFSLQNRCMTPALGCRRTTTFKTEQKPFHGLHDR
jgi:hypothetical protein